MSANSYRIPDSWGAKTRTFGIILVILVIVLIGPLMGILLASWGIVLAPPWISSTSLMYLPLACLGLPLGIVAVLRGWTKTRGVLATLIIAGIVILFYLAILGPWMPGGMTNCQPVTAPLPQVRYSCVSTSSDDPGYRYEFTLEGRAGWPVMRLVPATP